jgi:DNA polymerase-1
MVVLIDAANLAFRAYHSFISFSNSKGYPTGMVYGFFSILNSYANQFGGKVVITWEGGDLWRKNIYSEYKVRRKELDPEIKHGFQDLQKLCTLAGLLQIRKKGYEADDLISFVVRRIDNNIRIISNDKDLIQLVDTQKQVFLLRPSKEKGLTLYDEKSVKEEFKIEKSQIVPYLAICGDKSDNIIGIRGFGPVKTSNLINHNFDPIFKIKEMYPSEADRIDLNIRLIDLLNPKTMLKNISPNDIIWEEADLYALNEQFRNFEFRKYNAKDIILNMAKPDEQKEIYDQLIYEIE